MNAVLANADHNGQPILRVNRMLWITMLLAVVLFGIWQSRSSAALLVSNAVEIAETTTSCPKVPAADTNWYPPKKTCVNNLDSVVNGSGVYGFIFNSSQTPLDIPYSTYNWCNSPHVRPEEYVKPDPSFKLQYVEVIHRHHKRTPYADNTFPHESYPWSCDDEALFYYGAPQLDEQAAHIKWKVYTSDVNPFAPKGFNGTCQFPQITAGGLLDSRQHGEDLFLVYNLVHDILPETLDPSKVAFRVTTNQITSQVASQVILGMYRYSNVAGKDIQVSVQPASIDSLEPKYSCSTARKLYKSYGVGSKNSNWTAHLDLSGALFHKLDKVSGVNVSDKAWHEWFDHYFDNLSARMCHDKPLPCKINNPELCITQADAEAVFRRGEFEYSWIYRDSPQSLAAATASFGVWVAELATNLRAAIHGSSSISYRHNIAHDGSLSRLLAILQVDVMVWPSMGSEIVFELYSRRDCWFIRVLWMGQVLSSSNPSLGLMDMVPVEVLLDYIDELVGINASKVPHLCAM